MSMNEQRGQPGEEGTSDRNRRREKARSARLHQQNRDMKEMEWSWCRGCCCCWSRRRETQRHWKELGGRKRQLGEHAESSPTSVTAAVVRLRLATPLRQCHSQPASQPARESESERVPYSEQANERTAGGRESRRLEVGRQGLDECIGVWMNRASG